MILAKLRPPCLCSASKAAGLGLVSVTFVSLALVSPELVSLTPTCCAVLAKQRDWDVLKTTGSCLADIGAKEQAANLRMALAGRLNEPSWGPIPAYHAYKDR